MVDSEKDFDSIYGETIEKAIKTGFLFTLSINYYEQHTRDELIEKGESETRLAIAEKVLAHFGRSVGSKLGRCTPDLWSKRQCESCGVEFDIRKIDSLLRHHAYLCEECFHKREAEEQCSICKSNDDDPAIKYDLVGKVQKRLVARKTFIHICSWCALIKHNNKDFIRKRVEDYGLEQRVDAVRLGIELKDFEKHSEGDVARKRKDYYLEYDSHLFHTFEKPVTPDEVNEKIRPNPYFLILHPDDKRKLLRVYRIRVFYKYSLAFLELSFNKKSWQPRIDLINYGSVEEKLLDLMALSKSKEEDLKNRNEIEKEIKAVRKGVRLLNAFNESRGNYDLSALPDHYTALRPRWQSAQKEAEKDQQHPIHKHDWRDRLSAYQFPDDLIEWLNLDILERERNLASHPFFGYLKSRRESSKGIDGQRYELSDPRALALEQSARICGAPPYFYSTSYLKELIPPQRRTPKQTKK